MKYDIIIDLHSVADLDWKGNSLYGDHVLNKLNSKEFIEFIEFIKLYKNKLNIAFTIHGNWEFTSLVQLFSETTFKDIPVFTSNTSDINLCLKSKLLLTNNRGYEGLKKKGSILFLSSEVNFSRAILIVNAFFNGESDS